MLNKYKPYTVTEYVDNSKKKEVDFDQGMILVGIGFYNIKYCLLFALFLIASIVEVIGYSFILPSAKCDLDMQGSQRGLIGSMPYIAVVGTSIPWGYLVDTRGRKKTIILSSFGVAVFGTLAAFMPNLISFVIMKLLGSLCLACPSAVPYAFIGEILPQKHRDFALSITNAMQNLGSTLVPLLAWLILPLDFRVEFGAYVLRPWRVLVIIYSSLFYICGILMCFGPESPKFLVSQGRHEEALEVLKIMYHGNHGKRSGEFPVAKLAVETKESIIENRNTQSFFTLLKVQTLPLLRSPYLKWMALNGFLLFGLFATLNGLFMWVPDVLNRVLTRSTSEEMTACQIIRQRFNETNPEEEICNDDIDKVTFRINAIANISVSIITLLASFLLKFIGKKALLIFIYSILGAFCIAINFVTHKIVFSILLSMLQVTAVGIGPINAYAVQIFPTALRGMAISLGIMLGRTGSIIGTNVAGILINSSCEATFYMFGGLLFLCGLFTFLLPKSKT